MSNTRHQTSSRNLCGANKKWFTSIFPRQAKNMKYAAVAICSKLVQQQATNHGILPGLLTEGKILPGLLAGGIHIVQKHSLNTSSSESSKSLILGDIVQQQAV